jgi:hypothetical protein
MYNTDTDKWIESLNLTWSEELELRSVAGLGYPKPRNRIHRLFYSPLEGVHAFIALIVIIAFWAVLSYMAWRLLDVLEPLGEILRAFSLPILFLALFLGQRRHNGVVLKLYRALERERASVDRVEGE